MKHVNDSELQRFLRHNKPIAPTNPTNFEEKLFNLIENEPQFKRQKLPLKIVFPSAMAASLLLIIGGYSLINPPPKLAENDEEIERFLVNSWDSTIQGTYINHQNTPEGEWLMLTNYQSK